MGMASLKLFFNIILMLIVVTADENIRKCPNSDYLPLTEEEPTDYNMNLEINTKFQIQKGSIDIKMYIKKATMKITLHLRKLEVSLKHTWIKPIQHKYQENTTEKLYDMQYCPEHDIFIMIFGKILNPGKYLLHIEYMSLLHQKLGEIHRPFMKFEEKKWLFTNLYKSDSIRGLFPCWDNPAVKTSFRIKICYPLEHRAFSNMPAWSESKPGALMNMTCANFWETQVKPISHLTIGIFDNITTHPLSDEINNIWHHPGSEETLEYLHNAITSVMSYFSRHLELQAHEIIKKIDHVVISNSLMKSTGRHGLIIYREKDVRYDNNTDLPGKKIDILRLVAYEMARQWFFSSCLDNDMVLKNNDLLAAFYGYYVVPQITADHKYMDLLAVENIQAALDSDFLLDKMPLTNIVKNTDGINALHHSLLYRKKAFTLIRMLLHIMTPPKFQEAIAKYMQVCTLYPNGKENLWNFLQDIYAKREKYIYTIQEIMNSWLLTRYHPNMYFERKPGRSVYDYYSTTSAKDPGWKIPITFIVLKNHIDRSLNTSKIIWLEFFEKTLKSIKPEDFFIVNIDQIGFYRVGYDRRNWQGIYAYLNDRSKYKNIPVINRAQIINDAYYFTTKGEMDVSVFLNITLFLRHETDYIVWYPMFNIFARMSKFFDHVQSGRIKSHFIHILSGLLGNLRYENRPEDDAMMISLRTLAIKWACKIKLLGCFNAALKELFHYIDYPESRFDQIPAMWKDWVLCSGTRMLEKDVWMPLFHEAIRYDQKLFKYLACNEREDVIMKYLDLMEDPKTESLMKGEAYRYIIKRQASKDFVLDYFLENHNWIKKRLPLDFPGNDLLYTIIMSVYSKEHIIKVYKVVNKIDRYSVMYNTSKLVRLRKEQTEREQNAFKIFW
ncbi:aminopeptidase N-like [Odontomachus brunneus]|uniref:aminopeptidase N-like n=1 Tax=Odontomachus brunneus TaxID=486640 RepID=UPI0013F1A1CE|nr:aminopeptidase N-like [Odontomachus brunneus]